MRKLTLAGIGIALLLCVNHTYATSPDDLIAYTSMNGSFGKLNLATGYVTQGSCPPGFWDLDFAPDGTLYGLSRSTDALYRITDPETGQVEILTSLPGNSGGDPIAVSPDGNYIYFTVGIGAKPRTLYKYDINTSYMTTLGVIQAPKAFTGMQFTGDGTLYAIDGYNGSNGTKRLWTIDLNSLVATHVGPELFGINEMDVGGTADSLELAPDGIMYLLITPEGYSWPSNPHPTEYIGTIDLSTGLATINWDAPISGFDHCDTMAIIPEPGTPPVADADGPYSIYVGDTLSLDASGSTDDDNDIVSFIWDLDDNGSFETDAGGQAIFDVNYAYLESLELLINHIYTIHLKVTDSEGQSDVNDTTLTILPKPALQVAVDIKPGSCPNPVNTKSSGVLPVAILGSEDVNVIDIDPTSIEFSFGEVRVGAIRSGYEDVAAPLLDVNDCNCIEAGPDGLLDLTLKFETQGIVKAIGDVNDGDVLTLELTGVLYDPIPFERPIEGTDCILIKGKYKAHNKADINKDGVVNMIDFTLMAENWLQLSEVD